MSLKLMSSTPFTLSKVGIADNTPTTKHKTKSIFKQLNKQKGQKGFLSQLVIHITRVVKKAFTDFCMFRDTAEILHQSLNYR